MNTVAPSKNRRLPLLGESSAVDWNSVAQMLARPYRVTLPMVVLACMLPLYIFVPTLLSGRTVYTPDLALDHVLPVLPTWTLFYGPLYGYLILLPVLLVREETLIRGAVRAYLLVWITAFACFLAFPTVSSRPAEVMGAEFSVWVLNRIYSSDTPYNCFPSIHVAHSFVSALVCRRIHRGVGAAALVAASLVALSAVLIKQHYVLDLVAGVLLAFGANALFLRRLGYASVAKTDHRLAPVVAGSLLGVIGLVVACAWLVFQWNSGGATS